MSRYKNARNYYYRGDYYYFENQKPVQPCVQDLTSIVMQNNIPEFQPNYISMERFQVDKGSKTVQNIQTDLSSQNVQHPATIIKEKFDSPNDIIVVDSSSSLGTVILGSDTTPIIDSSVEIPIDIMSVENVDTNDTKKEPTKHVKSLDYWGPRYWYTYHITASVYPLNPTPDQQMKMRNFILAIPLTLPCKKCQVHATLFITGNYDKLNDICSSRTNLFNFFVDFHNHVNTANSKEVITYEEALKIYT